MFRILSFHPTQYNAIYHDGSDFYSISPPYVKPTKIIDADSVGSIATNKPIKSTKTLDGVTDYLMMKYLFLSLNNFYDLVKKSNEGSLIVPSKEVLEQKIMNKVISFDYLIKDNPLLLRNYLHTYWMWFGVDINQFREKLESIFNESSIWRVIAKDIHNLRIWKKDKHALLDEIKDTYLKRFKREKMWDAYKKCTFSLFFISDLLGYDDAESFKREHADAIEEYEKNTGRDAHHSPFKRHSDRRSRRLHNEEKWSKRRKGDD